MRQLKEYDGNLTGVTYLLTKFGCERNRQTDKKTSGCVWSSQYGFRVRIRRIEGVEIQFFSALISQLKLQQGLHNCNLPVNSSWLRDLSLQPRKTGALCWSPQIKSTMLQVHQIGY